jgi:ubiquinone/menaquinone biosynthesis C-methylase UbiE
MPERRRIDAIDTSDGTRAGGAWWLLRFAAPYDMLQRAISDPRREEEFRRRFLSVPDGASVLDIGCGTGRWRDAFGDVRYYGIEPSREYLEQARADHGSRGTFIEARAGDLPSLDLPRFDLVLCAGLLHHLDDREMGVLLSAAARVMAPGGRLVAVETCSDPALPLIARLAGRLDRGRFVRASAEYRSAALRSFRTVDAHVSSGRTRIPFPLVTLECRDPLVGAEARA